MFHFGAEVGFRRLNQIQAPAMWCLLKHSALAGLYRNLEFSVAVLEITTFLVANGNRCAEAVGYGIDVVFIPSIPSCCCVQHCMPPLLGFFSYWSWGH